MTESNPHAPDAQTPASPDAERDRAPGTEPRQAAGAEPRSFGGPAVGQDPEQRYADPAAPDAEEAQIAADDAGASAMAERAGRDIEQEGR